VGKRLLQRKTCSRFGKCVPASSFPGYWDGQLATNLLETYSTTVRGHRFGNTPEYATSGGWANRNRAGIKVHVAASKQNEENKRRESRKVIGCVCSTRLLEAWEPSVAK